jgi:hypothetical protein
MSTEELIRSARETSRRTQAIIDELKSVREEVRETVSQFRWWRFLGYDLETFDFVNKIDTDH